MTPAEIHEYCQHLTAKIPRDDGFIEPRFEAAKDEGRFSLETLHYRGLFAERAATLDALLPKPRLVLIGEPGAGKSTILREAARRLARKESGTDVPILLSLRSYRGSLQALAADHGARTPVTAADIAPVYLLDGLDEVPHGQQATFRAELHTLLSGPAARCIITARQAFFAEHADLLPSGFLLMHVLGWSERDLRQYAEARGLPTGAFLDAVRAAELTDAATNPFVARALADLYGEEQLRPTKSGNLTILLDRLIATRPGVHSLRQRRAVRMLAVAMETYAHNELSIPEAVSVLQASLGVAGAEAGTILEELRQSVLLQTTTGIAFQLRTYGEYLAAEELADKEFRQIRTLAFFDDGQPNDSWMNTIAYLAELQPQTRRYFCQHYPHWMLQASPAAFTATEREALVRQVLAALEQTGEFLINHPLYATRSVERFLTPGIIEELTRALASTRPDQQGNAVLLLGMQQHPGILPVALPIATDHGANTHLRYCAILALMRLGDPAALDPLIAALDRNDPLYIHVLDCIGTLATGATLEHVLPLLVGSSEILSSTYYHMRELRSREDLHAALRYLATHPAELDEHRAESYLEPLLSELPRYRDAETVTLCTNVLLAVERDGVFLNRSGVFPRFLSLLHEADIVDAVCRAVLVAFIGPGTMPQRLGDVFPGLVNEATAQWLIEDRATPYIEFLALRLPQGPVRDLLAPHVAEAIAQQEAYREEFREEDRQRQAARDTRMQELHDRIRTHPNILNVLGALAPLRPEEWPELLEERRAWLAAALARLLTDARLNESIVYETESRWTQPNVLDISLKAIKHYRLRLEPDTPLIYALIAWPSETIVQHVQDYGLSEAAREAFEALLADGTRNVTVQGHLLSFLEQTTYASATSIAALRQFVAAETTTSMLREHALRVIVKRDLLTDALLLPLLQSTNATIRQEAFMLLVKRQHRATVERALSGLLQDLSRLAGADTEPPYNSSLAWLGQIRAPWAWPKLQRLRQRALEAALVRGLDIVTNVMAAIDRAGLANVIRQQVHFAPRDWQSQQHALALDCARQARILAAQATPFEQVLRKLKLTTSMVALKVWCEGPTDLPVVRRLLETLDVWGINLDFIGGWPALLHREPERLLDGYREVIIVMDGDLGRHLDRQGVPYTPLAQEARRRFLPFPTITLQVLERYGIEHYFPRAAYEKVLGRDLRAYFPLPPTTGIETHLSENGQTLYRKHRNAEIAALITVADIQGSDLWPILESIRSRVDALRNE